MKRFIVFLILCSCLSTQAQHNSKTVNLRPPRPKVGVVLCGGGAKGAAHIGVLKYLEELDIPVDYVAGTSMGAILGGLYAMGYSPDELTELISAMNWSEYIGNRIDRSMMSEEARQRNSTLLFNIPFSLESLFDNDPKSKFISQLPSAYVNNSSLVNLFSDLCVGYQEEMDFNDLPIPFACIATDMVTGEEVVLRRGSLPNAMRASMAIPGVFSPVTYGDKVLVDGGLVNNFPADVLRDMGADIIIGVEISSAKEVSADDLKSLPQVFGQLITNSTNTKRNANRALCDVHILPDISGFGMLSFTHDAIDTLVGRGYQRASEFHDKLLDIKKTVDMSAGHPVGKTLRAPRAKNLTKEAVLIRSITIDNVTDRQSRWLIRKGRLKVGHRYSKDDIERALKVYRGTGCFDEITYQVKEADSTHYTDGPLSDAYDLHVNVKPAKPHFLGIGVRYDTEEGAALLINAGLNTKKFGGSKVNLSLKLSYNPKFNFTYTYSRASLANFNLSYDYRNEHFRTSDISTENLVNLNYREQKLSGYISQFHLLNLSTTVGASFANTTFDKSSLETSILDDWFVPNKFLIPFVNFKYDNLDNAYFAQHGLYASLNSHYYWDPKNGENNNFDFGYAFQYYITPKDGKVTIIPQVYGRYFLNETYFYNLRNKCGGEIEGRHFENQLPFVGITYVETFGTKPSFVNVARCDLRYNIYGKHYLTAMYNALLRWDSHTYHGAGLKYSYDSMLGPISLTTQWTNLYQSHFSAHFSFGYTF